MDPKLISLPLGHPDYNWRNTVVVSARAFARMNQHLRKRHGLIPPPEGQPQDGLVIYLADCATQHFPLVARALESEEELV